jgi:AAA domain
VSNDDTRTAFDDMPDSAPPTVPIAAKPPARRHRNGADDQQPLSVRNAILDAGEDDAPIPPRGWLLGNTFCRGFISGLLAQGASGKTSLRIAQALALTTDRKITGEHVFQRSRVLIVTLEDTLDELRRRVRAARLHHCVATEDVKGWLFLWAPAGMKVAEHREGSRIVMPGDLERRLRAEITNRRIDLVMIDPLVKAHSIEENDNGAIDAVAIILARLAADLNCAVDTLHHAPKAGASEPGDANRGRGASAFRDAARLLYTVTGMTETERDQFGLSEAERRPLIRLDSAKVNIAPPSIEARWFKIVGVPLSNGTDLYPHGDEVPTVELWQPPDLWRGISDFVANAILDEVDAGLDGGKQLYSDHPKATDRAASDLVRKHLPELSEPQTREVIKTWIKNGVLRRETYRDETVRKDRQGLRVNPAKRPGPRAP